MSSCCAAALAVHLTLAVGASFDFASFKTDAEADGWLKDSSVTYRTLVAEIADQKHLRGYRFAVKEDVPRGMVVCLDGYLEIQFNPRLAGADRVNTLIFEMANAARHRDHQQIDLAADEGLIRTAEEFGLAHEMLEYEALRVHRQILVEIASRAGPLPAEFFYFVTPAPSSLEGYRVPELFRYLSAQRQSGHTAFYYKLFRLRNAEQKVQKTPKPVPAG